MSITMFCAKEEIFFIVSGEVCQRILDWEYAFDEMVFNEQLTTGSFRGHYPVDEEMQTMMLMAKAKGRIIPYYGAGGGRGAHVYILQWAEDRCTIRIENEVMRESVYFIADAGVKANSVTTISEKPQIVFKINGKELENLRQWEYWHEDQANTSRYIYRFGRVAMGRLGYTIKINDNDTGNTIDVTSYEDW